MPDFDIRNLAELVKKTRLSQKMGLREAAKKIGGVSPSTLSRVEKESVPDLDTYIRLCDWLGVSPDRFIGGGETKHSVGQEPQTTPDIIAAHLRADRALNKQTAEAIAAVVRAAYEAAVKGQI